MAIMANTMDAAPRSPAQETRICWRREDLNGVSKIAVTSGLAIRVRNAAMAAAGSHTAAILEGKESSPRIKKISICIRLVRPSKKLTRVFLLGSGLLPNRIPMR